MKKAIKTSVLSFLAAICILGSAGDANALTYEDYPTIRLRSLDKITARTLTFDAQVGTIIKFGDIYIKILACRKPPAVEKTESAAFLQIWEVDKLKGLSRWIFSGWMFASSPSLSGMDHPVYDVWVIDCLGKDPDQPQVPPAETAGEKPLPDEGEVSADQVQEPQSAPEQTLDSQPDPEMPSATPAPTTEEQAEPEQETTPAEQQDQPEAAPQPAPTPEPKSESFDGIY